MGVSGDTHYNTRGTRLFPRQRRAAAPGGYRMVGSPSEADLIADPRFGELEVVVQATQ